jgi:hypothetical protein
MALPIAGENTNVLDTNNECIVGWLIYREPNTMLAGSLLAWCGKLD